MTTSILGSRRTSSTRSSCGRRRRRDYVIYNEYGRGQAFQPSEFKIGNISVSDGGMGIDATKPLGDERFQRAHYPVEKMDFSRWFSEAEIRQLKQMQDPYFRWLGEMGMADIPAR